MDTENDITNICKLRKQFDDIKDKHIQDSQDFVLAMEQSLSENNLPSIEEINKNYDRVVDKDRLLNIGIIGAVKAGKSSLLNALFFDGLDILPKAATPMTASLTELSYSENYEIIINFFTEEDIAQLQKYSHLYEQQFQKIESEEFNKQKEMWLSRKKRQNPDFEEEPSNEELASMKKNAQNKAKRDLNNNIPLAGSYEQYSQIINSPIPRKMGQEIISVSSIEDINGKLEDYVGANGKYTPFTSKVSLKLPLPSLKDICVIDTPGFNDPIPSRDEAARKALNVSDVVLIVSQAGTFLTANDKALMAKITQKEGIHELYLISSQIDTQLFSMSVADKFHGEIDGVTEYIKSSNIKHATETLSDINLDHVFDDLIYKTENHIFLTSGICESMAKTYNQKNNWDSGKMKVWENLTNKYPDYFSDADSITSINSLQMLGNIGNIRECIESIKSKKNVIFESKLASFKSKYINNAKETKKYLLNFLNNWKKEIQELNIAVLEEEYNTLNNCYVNIKPEIDMSFKNTVEDWHLKTKQDLFKRSNSLYNDTRNKIENSGEIKEWKETKGALFWKKEEHHSQITCNSSTIENAINAFLTDYNNSIPDFAEIQFTALKKQILSSMTELWNENSLLSSDNNLLSFRCKVYSLVKSVLDFDKDNFVCQKPSFIYKSFSSNSCRLTGLEAEICLDEAGKYISSLRDSIIKQISFIIDEIKDKFDTMNFAEKLLTYYKDMLEEKKNEMLAPQATIFTIDKIAQEVEKIQC